MLTHAFYALVLSSGVASSLLVGRIAITREWTFIFLMWNLFLAWVPYLGSLWAASVHQRHPRQVVILLLPGVLWLLFLPNAPYIITDFVHYRPRDSMPWWYDLGLLASFAWSGTLLGIVSLQTMQRIVWDLAGRAVSWLFVLAVSGLTGYGIYLGRFGRWNSLDALLSPHPLLVESAALLRDPTAHLRPLGVTLIFAALVFTIYLTFAAHPQRSHGWAASQV